MQLQRGMACAGRTGFAAERGRPADFRLLRPSSSSRWPERRRSRDGAHGPLWRRGQVIPLVASAAHVRRRARAGYSPARLVSATRAGEEESGPTQLLLYEGSTVHRTVGTTPVTSCTPAPPPMSLTDHHYRTGIPSSLKRLHPRKCQRTQSVRSAYGSAVGSCQCCKAFRYCSR